MGVVAHILYQFLLEIIALIMLNGFKGIYKQDQNIYTACVTCVTNLNLVRIKFM